MNISPVAGGKLAIHKMGLGRDDFLKLLVTQMKNQNPLEPLNSQEFVAQLATFSTLEQIIQLNESFTSFMNINSRAGVLSILGKEVSAKLADGSIITGRAKEIEFKDSKPIITINSTKVNFENIISVK